MTIHTDDEGVQYGLIVSGEPPRSEEVETSARALEVVVMWGEREVLEVAHLSPPRSFHVGEAEADYLVGADLLGTSLLPVVLCDGGACSIVIPADARGDVAVGTTRVSTEALIAAGHASPCNALPGAFSYALPPGSTARISYRGFTFVVRAVQAGKAVGREAGGFDLRQQLWTGVSLAVHGLLLGSMYFLPPGASALSLDMSNDQTRLASYLLQPVERIEDTPDWANSKDDSGGDEGRRAKGDEGQAGEQKAPETHKRFAIKGRSKDQQLARDVEKEQAQNAGILGALNAAAASNWMSPTSRFGADQPLGYDPADAIGALFGEQPGESFGFNGLGMRGTGRDGGGDAEGTIGVGKLGTIGHGGKGGGPGGYGHGAGGLRGRENKAPLVRTGAVEAHGSLSKEAIRRAIHLHISEVRHCYEQELMARPDLGGRVQVKFVINPSGAVQAAQVESSTLGSQRAESCIATAVRRWTFPAPEGGGVVIVSYPFLLDHSE